MTEPTEVLQAIRDHELRVAQEIEGARDRAEAGIAEARAEARRAVENGKTRGRRMAAQRYQDRMEEARRAADAILSDAGISVRRLHEDVEPRLNQVVDAMVELLLSPPAGGDD